MVRESFETRNKAQEFDIETLLNPGGKAGFLCLSESTWELCYNLVLFYGYWRSRYYYSDPDTGEQLTITDEEYTTITDVVDLALEELQMSSCEDILASLNCICTAIQNLSLVGTVPPGATGTVTEPVGTTGDEGSENPPGYGEEPNDILEHCQMSNYYYRQLKSLLEAILYYNVLGLLQLGIALGAAQILAILGASLAAGFFGLVFAQIGIFLDFLQFLITSNEDDIQDIIDELDADEGGFICAMYCAGNISDAAGAITAWGDNAGLTEGQIAFMLIILNPYVLAGLYFPSEAALADANEMTDLYDCDNCVCVPETALFYTNPNDPYNTILAGFADPQWDETPASPGDITESAGGGWCSQTIRGAGTYRQIKFYFPNPNYGGSVTTTYSFRIDFTLQNCASQSWLMWCGSTLGQSNVVRGPGYSSNAFRANTSGSPPLDTYVEFDANLDTTTQVMYISSLFYYDSNYNNAQPGCMRKFLLVGEPA